MTTKTAGFQIRQGDVFVEATDEQVPKEAKPVPRDGGRVVLAYGEITGHAHAFGAKATAQLFRFDDSGIVGYLQIDGVPEALQHEEHGEIAHPPGTHRVVQQQEWTLEHAARAVAD